MLELLTRMASTTSARSRDMPMADIAMRDNAGASAASAMALDSRLSPASATSTDDGLYPSESTQLSICVNLLHALRYDLITQQLKAIGEQRCCLPVVQQASWLHATPNGRDPAMPSS